MTAAHLSPADLAHLRAAVRERWPACAEAQGIGRHNPTIAFVDADGALCIVGHLARHEDGPVARATESLARILEDAGYAIERRGSARIVTGWAMVSDDVRVASLDPWDPLRRAYDDRLHRERAERDAPRREGIGGNAKVEHAVAVNEMARRSR